MNEASPIVSIEGAELGDDDVRLVATVRLQLAWPATSIALKNAHLLWKAGVMRVVWPRSGRGHRFAETITFDGRNANKLYDSILNLMKLKYRELAMRAAERVRE